jgi:hypothetical protein
MSQSPRHWTPSQTCDSKKSQVSSRKAEHTRARTQTHAHIRTCTGMQPQSQCHTSSRTGTRQWSSRRCSPGPGQPCRSQQSAAVTAQPWSCQPRSMKSRSPQWQRRPSTAATDRRDRVRPAHKHEIERPLKSTHRAALALVLHRRHNTLGAPVHRRGRGARAEGLPHTKRTPTHMRTGQLYANWSCSPLVAETTATRARK